MQGTDREFLAEQWAVEFAAALGLPVLAVHVRASVAVELAAEAEGEEPPDHFAFVRRAAERWGVPFESRTVDGTDVPGVLIEELTPRDVVVIGTRRLGGAFHVGSVAAEIVRRAPCPVQVIRLNP